MCFVLISTLTLTGQSFAGGQSTKNKVHSTQHWQPDPAAASVTTEPSLVSTSTLEGRLAVFDDVWETIQDRYYDPAHNGIDWQAKRNAFRPAAAKANTTYELYDVLRQMIASLKDAHTRVYSPDEKFDWWKPRYVTAGLTIREIEGLPIVVQVDPNSAAAKTDIRVGDTLVSVDDVPVARLIAARLENFGPRSDGSARYRTVATLFDGPAGTNVKVAWTTRDGKSKSAILQRYWSQRQLGFNNQRKGNIALLRIDAFTQSVALEFSKALPDVLDGANGIVLDLRSNGGGDAEAMADVASLFLDDGINLGRFADRSGASFELQTYSKRLWRVPQVGRIKLPLVVLTSESTSSAAEIMVAALQMKGRARVIGTVTCGCVLAIRNRHPLPDGGLLDVSEFDYRTANGVRLEGLGIKPDDVITLLKSDIYSRRDPALEVAKNVLKSR
ncbi:MAG TPA: S41 family peptidase [Pyrinomonadaceae bacterium]|nr:S41 family peptidase [Pyrinomonadaceae bacterium]